MNAFSPLFAAANANELLRAPAGWWLLVDDESKWKRVLTVAPVRVEDPPRDWLAVSWGVYTRMGPVAPADLVRAAAAAVFEGLTYRRSWTVLRVVLIETDAEAERFSSRRNYSSRSFMISSTTYYGPELLPKKGRGKK